jgi:hypothetical protein
MLMLCKIILSMCGFLYMPGKQKLRAPEAKFEFFEDAIGWSSRARLVLIEQLFQCVYE